MYKFRAWDKKNKCYIPEWQDATRLIEKHGFNGGDQFIVEPCVWVKDRYGTHAYAGDIVVVEEQVSQIKYCEGNLAFFVSETGEPICDYLGWEEDLKIIGTVNENAELLEVDNE